MLGAGTIVTVRVQGEAKGLLTKDDLLAGVIQDLGYLPLMALASTIDAGSILYNAATFQWFHYQYVSTVTVTTPADTYDTAEDVGRAVAQSFESIAGSTPTAVQATLQSSAPAIGAPAGANLLPDLSFSFTWLALLIAGIVVLAIVAVGWGKNNLVVV